MGFQVSKFSTDVIENIHGNPYMYTVRIVSLIFKGKKKVRQNVCFDNESLKKYQNFKTIDGWHIINVKKLRRIFFRFPKKYTIPLQTKHKETFRINHYDLTLCP